MEETAQVTCFGFKQKKAEKRSSRSKSHVGKPSKIPSTIRMSPASSLNSDDGIKAHRLDLAEDARLARPEQVDAAAELARERAQRHTLEEQLATALNINAEMKLALALSSEEGGIGVINKKVNKLKSQLQKERKDKEEAEMQLAASKREGAAMKAALGAARTQRDDLEAELMEAALDIMDHEKHRSELQNAKRIEREARQMTEQATAESEGLRLKLRQSEASRAQLEEKIQAMTVEAGDWELALDSLQARLEEAIVNRPLDSIATAPYDAYAPTTPDQKSQFWNNSVVKADVVINQELKPAPKAAPWRQVVVERPALA